MRYAVVVAVALLLFLRAAALSQTQASIAGVVRDTSGAVLPGVTVEAASPALIEKVRSVVTDGTGQYRIVDSPARRLHVTFTLPGFSTVKREGIELTGSFVATVNADMRVGALEETITVTGETPTVDVQSTAQQRGHGPRGPRHHPDRAQHVTTWRRLIPGCRRSSRTSAGAGTATAATPRSRIHGSRAERPDDLLQRHPRHSARRPRPARRARHEHMAARRRSRSTSAATAESGHGGVRINIDPAGRRQRLQRHVFVNFANDDMQATTSPTSSARRARRRPTRSRRTGTSTPAFGGPIRRDRLWFYVSAALTRRRTTSPGSTTTATRTTRTPGPTTRSQPAGLLRQHPAPGDAPAHVAGDAEAQAWPDLAGQQENCGCPRRRRAIDAPRPTCRRSPSSG